MMEKVRLSFHTCLLLILHAGSVLGNSCYEADGKRCKTCNPGYYLNKDRGMCHPCPFNSYADYPNDRPFCTACVRCEGIFQYKETCLSTKNAKCECIPGRQCANAQCTRCKNNPCPTGQELRVEKCMNCPHGTFNNGTDGICKPWTNCSVVLVNGTHTSDVICDIHKITKRMTTSAAAVTSTAHKPEENGVSDMKMKDVTIIIIASTCFIVLCLVAFGLILSGDFLEKLKNNFKKIPIVKQTEQEDACSCHFPEEEHGEEEPMTEEP